VRQQLGAHVGRLGPGHLGSRAEQRRQRPGIPVDEVGDGPRDDDAAPGVDPQGAAWPPVQHGGLGHRGGGEVVVEVGHGVPAAAVGATEQACRQGELGDGRVAAVAVCGGDARRHGDVAAATLVEQVDDGVDDGGADGRGWRQPDQHDRRSDHGGRETVDRPGQGRNGATPDHGAGQRVPALDTARCHASNESSAPAAREGPFAGVLAEMRRE
jgi:hypothetical protein